MTGFIRCATFNVNGGVNIYAPAIFYFAGGTSFKGDILIKSNGSGILLRGSGARKNGGGRYHHSDASLLRNRVRLIRGTSVSGASGIF